jgi:hypothetical protein
VTFLNIVLLGGVAAFSIPVVIHLFHRSRFRVVRWGAMHLLDQVIRRNMRRIRLEQLILLLVRCAIPALLAVCMARPVLMGVTPWWDAKSSTVVLLDDSYSMEAGGAAGSNFNEARAVARQVLENLVDGSDAAAIPMSAAAPAEPSFDTRRLSARVEEWRSGYGAAEVPRALDAAAATLARMHHAHREVVVVSDFQRVSWEGREGAARARAADRFRAGGRSAHLTLVRAGSPARENVSVDSPLELTPPTLGVGQRLQVRANLRNHGDAPFPGVKVVFKADGVERGVTEISLPPGEKGQVLFTHVFDTPGSHTVEVAAEADSLRADNACLAAIPVWDRVPVLLVSGDANPEPLLGETDFIEIALRPYASAKSEGLADLVASRTVEPREIEAKLLAEFRVAVLANVPQLGAPQLRALEDFVRDGGGLLVFPGNRINSAWYNTTLAAEGRGLLPLPVASLAGTLTAGGGPSAVASQFFEHEALQLFNDPRHGRLSDAEIRLWYRLREGAPGVSVLARLQTGDPFLVEKTWGNGRVLQGCAPCDADWGNLPLRPAYLPLMQQLVTYLASKVFPPRNVDVGRPLVAFLPASDAGKPATVTDPDGKVHPVAVADRGSRGVVEFPNTRRPGLYVLDAPRGGRVHFVVNTDRKESDLRPLDEPELLALARSLGAEVVHSWSEYRQLEQRRRYGQEVWPFLLAAVIGLVFLEMFLAQRFARRKP